MANVLSSFLPWGRPVLFIDIEANGFGMSSYPIEAAFATSDEDDPTSFLIRPTSAWRERPWSYEAERIHGIPMALLDAAGEEPAEVCARLVAMADGACVVSDAPEHDGAWLDCLFEAAGRRPPFAVEHLRFAVCAAAKRIGIDECEASLVLEMFTARFPAIHRAGPDAVQMAQAARAALDREFRGELFGEPGVGIVP